VQTHALALLRSGDTASFPALVRRVLDDVRAAGGGGKGMANGAEVNGKKVNGAADGSSAAGLAVPHAVIEEALKVARESLEAVVEMEGGGGGAGGGA
jgi:hypothetical protein